MERPGPQAECRLDKTAGGASGRARDEADRWQSII